MLHHNTYTVGTTPTLIASIPEYNPYTAVLIFNNDNSQIFIGDASVTTSGPDQGLPISKSTVSSQIWLSAEDKLYAISAAGTAANSVTVLFSGPY